MNPRLLLLVFLAAITTLRWALAASREISPSEAYLALCGFSPSPAIFDGPAGTALSVALGTTLAGASGLGAALLWPVFAALATLALYALVGPLAGRPAACCAAVLLNLLPAFNSAAITPSPALPLAMCSLAFFASAWRALEQKSLPWWLAAGCASAAALLFTYAAAFLIPSMALVLLISRRWRRHLVLPGIWVATLPSLAVLALLISWNRSHGWVHFIGGTWQTALNLDPSRLPGAMLAGAAAANPFALLILALAVFFGLHMLTGAPKVRFILIPALAGWLLTLYLVLRGTPAGTLAITSSALTLPALAFLPAHIGRHLLPTVMIASALWTAAATATQNPPAAPVTARAAAEIETLRRQASVPLPAPVFLIAEDAGLASALALLLPDHSFATPGHPPVFVPESPYADSQYALWPRYDQFVPAPPTTPDDAPDPFTEQDGVNPFLGRSAFFVTSQAPADLPQSITAAFASCRLLAEISGPSGTTLRVYLCSDYQTLPL